ncbi:hypothetical protein AKJ16_DCAP22594, partial [Drosera capensis]
GRGFSPWALPRILTSDIRAHGSLILGCWAMAQMRWAEKGPDAQGGDGPWIQAQGGVGDVDGLTHKGEIVEDMCEQLRLLGRLKGELVMWMDSHIRGRLLRICVSRFTHIDHEDTERVEYIYEEPITHQLRLLG